MRPPKTYRRFTSVLAVLAGSLLLLPPGAAAAPGTPTGSTDQLSRQITALEKKYGGDMALLRDTKWAADQALTKAVGLQTQLQDSRTQLSRYAADQYMTRGADPITVISGANPSDDLAGAALAEHLALSRAARVQQVQTLVDQQRQAAVLAQTKITALEQEISGLLSRKGQLQKLVNRYKPQSPLIGNNNLTARMIAVRTEIDGKFGPFPSIGCYRPGDPQDHGTGHACDFMESSGGVLPTADRVAHGDQVAAYAIANASRLGIKYIIWKQRIYDMRSPGWSPMADRGGITANHLDHVHISVF